MKKTESETLMNSAAVRNSPTKIVVTLIHNNDQERLSAIRGNIQELVSTLNNRGYQTIYFESHYQPEITEKEKFFVESFIKSIAYWKIGRNWNKYKKSKNRFLPFDLAVLIARLIKNYSFKNRRDKIIRRHKVEIFLTNKHIESLNTAAKEKADIMIAFEDDAVFKEDSIKKIVSLLENYGQDEKKIYFDLAGGCNLQELGYENILERKEGNVHFYSKLVTNTTCAYIINRKTYLACIDFVIKKPHYRYIAIDWLCNAFFMHRETKDEGIVSLCAHSHPPILEHGSATGKVRSEIR